MQNTNKRWVAALLLSGLLLGGCVPTQKDHGTTNGDDTTVETPAGNVNEDEAYLGLEVRPCMGLSRKTFGLEDSLYAIRLNISSEWEMKGAGMGEYDLYYEDTRIGKIENGEASDASDWTVLATEQRALAGMTVRQYLEKSGTGESLRFRYRYRFAYMESGEERVLSVSVAYTELDDFSRQALMTKTVLLNVYTDPMYDTLSELRGESLLLLGNSFIGSSQIGSILNDMMQQNGKSCNATAISRGYARVSTYTSDASMMNRIRNGEWGAVFICGFYDDETKCLGLLKDACDASGTKLIIFPAHNENSGVIEKNRNTYPTLPCLNWKSEIEALIAEGRSQWDFCVDDQHLHSTPLAGYVGAMMIYRSIYGQMPTARMYSIDQAAYDDVLGAYMDDPSMQLMNTKGIIPVG
jgi:hypothetical protein